METVSKETKKVTVIGIKWDADEQSDLDGLSADLTFEMPLDEFNEFFECEDEGGFEEYIADKISDISGFCHDGWEEYRVA